MRALLLALTLSVAGCGTSQARGARDGAAWLDEEALAAWRDETPSAIVRLRTAPRTALLEARRPTPASRPPGLAGAHIDVRFRRAPLADALRLLADQA
ncbi:MAG TPA: hypothetical protein RMH80_15280, partial [Polyangiaceae bacterium LLY-WYZ-15_(1-7)]|nr:hypothetical protein [Polyangiaceae bacterium LLY-WYZ-15_(1-7)]